MTDMTDMTELPGPASVNFAEWDDNYTLWDAISFDWEGNPVVAPTWQPKLVSWRWVLGPWTGRPRRELVAVGARRVDFARGGPCTATFSLAGSAAEAAEIEENYTDLWVYADTNLVYRGRVIAVTDTVTANADTVTVDTVDYRGLLERRILDDGDPANFSEQTYADIAWRLFTRTQEKPGGFLQVTRGVWQPDVPAAIPRVRNYEAGAEIGHLIDNLSEQGFDWSIDAGLRFNLWAPSKARRSGFVAELGGNVTGFTRWSGTSTWANAVRTSGEAEETVGRRIYRPDPAGLFEKQVGLPDVKLQSTVDERAPVIAASWYQRKSTLNLTLRPGVVASIGDLDTGDQILVVLRTGRLNIVEWRLVDEISVVIDDSGIPATTLGIL